MKPFLWISASFLFSLGLFTAASQTSEKGKSRVSSVTFRVCTVPKATEKLETVSYRQAQEDALKINRRNYTAWQNFIEKTGSLTPEEKGKIYYDTAFPQPIKIEAAAKSDQMLVATQDANAIAAAMVEAYAGHRPLVLSPDMIWLLILQGFGAHIEANPEGMRPYFVDFQGEKTLEVYREGWIKGDPDNPWENVFEEFGEKIAANTKQGVAETCLPRFSTTGIVEKAAFDISLMRAMDPFFDYKAYFTCGIPEITLEGTPEDWELLEKHAAQLAKFDLAWWIDPLKPVLHEFSNASRGQVDTVFWQNMVQRRSYSVVCAAQPFLSGWMLRFFPYISNERNPWISKPDSVQNFEAAFAIVEAQRLERVAMWERIQKIKNKKEREKQETAMFLNRSSNTAEPEQFGLSTLEVSDFPASIGNAKVILNAYGIEYNLEFHSGFIGIRQDEQTLTLRPEISWIILDTGLRKGEDAANIYAAAAKAMLDRK